METTITPTEVNNTIKTTRPERVKKLNESAETKQRYIYTRKDSHDPVANLIDKLLNKCNQKDQGAAVDFSLLVSYSLRLLKDSDIAEIQSSTLSDEDRAYDELKKFNTKHGTNFTLYEFVLNGLLKQSKKGVNQ